MVTEDAAGSPFSDKTKDTGPILQADITREVSPKAALSKTNSLHGSALGEIIAKWVLCTCSSPDWVFPRDFGVSELRGFHGGPALRKTSAVCELAPCNG